MYDTFWGEMGKYALIYNLAQLAYKLVPVIGGVMAAYHLIMRMKAQDEHEAAQHARGFRNVLVAGLVVVASLWLLDWSVGFTKYSSTKAQPCYGAMWGKTCP